MFQKRIMELDIEVLNLSLSVAEFVKIGLLKSLMNMEIDHQRILNLV